MAKTNVKFSSFNVDGVKRDWNKDLGDMLVEFYVPCEWYDLPSLDDEVVNCMVDGNPMHATNFAEVLLYAKCWNFIANNVASGISDDYKDKVMLNIIDDVAADVKETSEYADTYDFNDDDIKLAVGRVMCNRLGMSV